MVLPIWLWLVICVIILAAGGVAWLRKLMVTDPRSARAVATGRVIADAKLESHCRSSVADNEVTAPGQTSFVTFLAPLQFASGRDHARTPISLALSERTLGISYKQGALGNIATLLINRRDIKAGNASDGPGGFSYTIETSTPRSFMILLQSEQDRHKLASWVVASPLDHR